VGSVLAVAEDVDGKDGEKCRGNADEECRYDCWFHVARCDDCGAKVVIFLQMDKLFVNGKNAVSA
jgi:hypothetical protein